MRLSPTVVFLLFVAAISAAVWFYGWGRRIHGGMNTVANQYLTWGICIAAVRVGALLFLIYSERTHQQSLALVPLILLLYPEGLMLSNQVEWTAGRAALFGGALVVGSFLWAAIIVFLINVPRLRGMP